MQTKTEKRIEWKTEQEGDFMNIRKPDKKIIIPRSISEEILRWLLSRIKGTPEYMERELEKNKKY